MLTKNLDLQGAVREPENEMTITVRLETNQGEAVGRYHPVRRLQRGAVLWVGGAGGGFNGPAAVYPEMAHRFQPASIASLRLDYRFPNELEDCVMDVLAGIEFLAGATGDRIVLVGHSFGGAVVIAAGALSPRVKAVVPIATQSYGTEMAPEVAPRPMLLIHGSRDDVLPETCSRHVYRRAKQPKELRIFEGAGHGLDEVRDELMDLLSHWIPPHFER